MATIIRKNISLLGYEKFVVFLIGCIIFSISGRTGEVLTFEQNMVSAVSDHYYLTYFVIPIVLFFYLVFIEDDSEIVLVRYKSYCAYFCQKWFACGVIPLIIILIQTICIIVSSLGLKMDNVWNILNNSPNTELFEVLSRFFSSPLCAFIIYSIFQFLGMWFLIGICMWIAHFVGKKQATCIIVGLYVFSALWIKIPALCDLPLIGINHLIILHHNLESMKRIAITLIVVIVLFITILYTVCRFWRYRFRFFVPKQKGIFAYYNRLLISKTYIRILSVVVIGILLYKGFNIIGNSFSEEWIYHVFLGHGTGYFHILSFLEMLIVNGTPLYLLALFIEKSVSEQSLFVSIRSGCRNKIVVAIMMVGILFLLTYCVMWLVGGMVSMCILGYGFRWESFCCLIDMTMLKLLDLSVQYMLMLAIYISTKQIVAGFLVLIAGNFLCVVPIKCMLYLPFGLSSAMRIVPCNSYGISVLKALIILLLYLTVLVLWHLKFGYRKILD